MTLQQGLESLLSEVDAVLGTDNLAPQRQTYFEGARDYLTTLQRICDESPRQRTEAKNPRPRIKSLDTKVTSKDTEAKIAEHHI